MKTVVLDTNALVSFVTDRDPFQQEKAAAWFERAAVLKVRLLIPFGCVMEFVYVMTKVYRVETREVRGMILALARTPGLEFPAGPGIESVLSLWPDPVTEFGDAQAVAVSLEHGRVPVLSFDRKLLAALNRLDIPSAADPPRE